MTERTPPADIDVERPNPGRIYDWFLGGDANWAIDRVFGQRLLGMWPQIAGVARQNRAYLQRVVVDALQSGVHQFLDLGSGIPTVGNVHEIVEQHSAEPARVVYVDCEPVATAHSQVMLEGTPWAGAVQADLMDRKAVLKHETTRQLLDLDRPVCLLAVAVLQFIGPDCGIAEALRRYAAGLAPGSRIVLSHFASDVPDPESRAAMERFRTECDVTPNPLWLRDRETIDGWLQGLGDDWRLVAPGVANLPDWRPDLIPGERARAEAEKLRPFVWCGMAEKR